MEHAKKIFRVPADLYSPAEKVRWKGFMLESGIRLGRYHLAYHTYGRLNTAKNNVVWIFHALTANSDPHEWWNGLVGNGKIFDPDYHFIICVNVPGSCYGSLSPLDIDVTTGFPYYHQFPHFTTRDIIRSFQPLRRYLGIEKINIAIGGSLGGQQLLEWACEEPELFENIIPIATNAFHSPWGIAFNTAQRMAIEADGTWPERHAKAGEAGMKAARAMALISYRSYEGYKARQPYNHNQLFIEPKGEAAGGASSYQRYQGDKLAMRFNAFSYYQLSKTMDSHNLGRGRDGVENALARIQAKALVVGIDSDVLFPQQEQRFVADHIKQADFVLMHSLYGHDGFLLEYKQLQQFILDFLTESQAISIDKTKFINSNEHIA